MANAVAAKKIQLYMRIGGEMLNAALNLDLSRVKN